MLFTDEVKDMNEFIDKIKDFDLGDRVKVAVVCFVFDKSGKLILNRRGPGARDEIGKLQALGGSINADDADFRSALLRELREEGGDKAKVSIDYFIGAQKDGKFDNTLGEYVNWIILGYKGTVQEGELINAEPDRSVGLEKGELDEFKKEELSITAYNFIQELMKIEK